MRVPPRASYTKAIGLSSFRRAVYSIVARIPWGRILTYGQVAVKSGAPGAARAVGTALAQNCYRDVPCYRVVRSDGSIGDYAFGGTTAKAVRLKREGVRMVNGRVVFLK